MQKDDFPLYNTNQKIKLVTKNNEPCKINILYIIYLKKNPKTIIRLPLIINTVVCVLAHTYYSCDSIKIFYSDSTTFLNITDFSYLKKNS